MAPKPTLNALSTEWRNAGHEDMQDLLQRVLVLKGSKSYEQLLYDLATNQFPRTAQNPEYVAHLLYLIDERRYPIVALQPIIHIHQGHIYRTLGRAGVEFVAVQSSELKVDEALYSWPCQVHVDPSRETIAVDGVEYAFGDPKSPVLVWLDGGENEEKTFRLSYRENQGAIQPPVPRLRRRTM